MDLVRIITFNALRHMGGGWMVESGLSTLPACGYGHLNSMRNPILPRDFTGLHSLTGMEEIFY